MAQKPAKSAGDVTQIVEQSDIVQVAAALGLQLDKKQTNPRRALCPFHNDRSPSLHLYQKNGSRDNFHCFSCGANGDIVSLVQRRMSVEFWDAIKWLAPFVGVALVERVRDPVDRHSGSALFAERLRNVPHDADFAEIADRRGFSPDQLGQVGAAPFDLAPLRQEALENRLLQETLQRAGIFRSSESDARPAGQDARSSLRGFYAGKRIVFPLNDLSGAPVGFAARALADETPRYLYSFQFPRRDTLYGADRVARSLVEAQRRFTTAHVYVVEGIFDQLRLETLGMDAVALLGSQVTEGQVSLLRRLAALAESADRELTFRIFLDPDQAGFLGAYDLLIALMRLLGGDATFGIEVILPSGGEGKADPDTFLREHTPDDAGAVLDKAVHLPLQFMLQVLTGRAGQEVALQDVSSIQLAGSARRIANSLPDVSWSRVLAPLEVGAEFTAFADMVRSYGDGLAPLAAPAAPTLRQAGDSRSALISALTMGRSSTQRREYPLDDDAWDRLAVAASPLFHIHCHRLSIGDGPMSPLLARHLPKGGGRKRLKAGPVAADALLQQYALIELLRDRSDAPGFSDRIPAVRYDRNRVEAPIYRTGPEGNTEALSFAYQVDMEVINGFAPPRREGIFRPYFECWRSFIDFLDGKIRRYQHEELQILRLDVTGFYEFVKFDVVGDALQAPLELALAQLGQADGGPAGFARLLQPDPEADAARRAHVFTDFLLRHAFHSDHRDPETGKPAKLAGLPQGPDLSAYLANISLFALDDLMRAEIARIDASHECGEDGPTGQRCSAAYARYVDDIIIICPNADIAGQLRRKIEAHLQVRGLSLNRKNPTPPTMTRDQARNWLTDNRVGFGFSGPLADMPVVDTMDPLADAGDIDRRTALGLLFDPELDDLRNPARIIDRITKALHATEIRFGDRANAYRRLWLLAAIGTRSSARDIADAFRDDALRVDVGARTLVDDRFDIALAAFEALERALRARIPEGIDEDATDLWYQARIDLARCVLGDPFTPVATALLGDGEAAFLQRLDVRCHIAMIACLAVSVLEDAHLEIGEHPLSALQTFFDPNPGAGEPLPEGLRLSLFRRDAAIGAGLAALPVPSEFQVRSAFYRLETALVRLQQFDGTDGDLPPASLVGKLAPGIESMAARVLRIWLPDDDERAAEDIEPIEVDAAATLINITYRHFPSVAAVRPRLIRIIAGQRDAQALPSPPGLETSGVMMWCDSGKLLFAAAREDAAQPVGVEWSPAQAPGPGGLHLWESNLAPSLRPLFTLDKQWGAGEIAEVYLAGFRKFFAMFEPGEGRVPVPTAFSFFAHVDGDTVQVGSMHLVCWSAARAAVDGHAFVRNGTSLEARPVHLIGADHWRYGWAVRDLCSRSEGPAEDDISLEAHGDLRLDREMHRREAILARVLPRLSGADRWGPGPERPETGIPTRIERALRLLTAFGQTNSAESDVTYLVAASAEGVFMSERLNSTGDVSQSGRPAALAVRAARRVSRSLPAASELWSRDEPFSVSGRRSAAAWFATACRLRTRVDRIDEAAGPSLSALALGMDLLGTVAELRSLAFEIAAALPSDSLDKLCRVPIDLSFVTARVGAEVSLIDDPEMPGDGDPAAQAHRVLMAFAQIVQGRRTSAAATRDAITPLGWLVLVAVLLQVAPPETDVAADRPVLWHMSAEAMELASSSIEILMPFVGASAPNDSNADNWPWDIFVPMLAALPTELVKYLRELSNAAAIKIETLEALSNPRTSEVVSGRPVLRLSDGTSHRLSEWQIDVAFVAGERRLSTECAELEGRIRYRYSVARSGERVLGLHLVSQSLADIAFGSLEHDRRQETTASDSRAPTGPELDHDGRTSSAFDRDNLQGGATDQAGANDDETIKARRGLSTRASSAPRQPAVAIRRGDAERSALAPDEAMAQIRMRQDKLWSDRAKRGHSLQRVAIVQWDVADSYYSPGYRDGKHEGLRDLSGEVASAKAVRAGGAFQSVAEQRRRSILRQVLRACAQFRVDGLVLPEYSVRAETVNWLSRQLAGLNLPLTVWCGTFRVPDGTVIYTSFPHSGVTPYFQPLTSGETGTTPWHSHSALLTCIDAFASEGETQIRCYMRRKRYPSAAAGELIRPAANEPWQPLLVDSRDAFRLGTYTVDLVCSEMFLHASSANFIGILEENRGLASRYAVPWPDGEAINSLKDDMYVFARWTSYRSVEEPQELSRGKAMQRTVMILPAMTSRSADYHIFGQNQYLASGLVTAFCNAVEPTAGCGGSAFVGLDGWKTGSELATPYGSLAPGIYQMGDKHSGPLGEKEAAMVIADIDPVRTTDLKPRPHYQSRSLQLVAHLPIMFSTETDQAPAAHGTRDRKPRKRVIGDVEMSFLEASSKILEVLEATRSWRDERAVASADSAVQAADEAILQSTLGALDLLPVFADDPSWLHKRAKAFREKRWLFSPPLFLPALTDWLFVDDGWVKSEVNLAGKHPLEADEDVLDVPRDCGEFKFEAPGD